MSTGFSYKNTADIVFSEWKDIGDLNTYSWIYPSIYSNVKIEDIYGLERSKKWVHEFMKTLAGEGFQGTSNTLK